MSASKGIFFFLWISFKLINTKLFCAVTHLLFNYAFQKLSFTGKAGNANGTDISVNFPEFFFLCSVTFLFREFVFEWDLNEVCETPWCLWAVAGQEI